MENASTRNTDFEAPGVSVNYNLPAANPFQAIQPTQPAVPPAVAYQMAFPEIYYKLQPYVMMACDQMDLKDSTMINQDMLDSISDSIYDDIRKRDPTLAEYVHNQESAADSNPVIQTATFGDPGMFGWRFRRRGLFRDLIDILLLSELFGRRRRRFF